MDSFTDFDVRTLANALFLVGSVGMAGAALMGVSRRSYTTGLEVNRERLYRELDIGSHSGRAEPPTEPLSPAPPTPVPHPAPYGSPAPPEADAGTAADPGHPGGTPPDEDTGSFPTQQGAGPPQASADPTPGSAGAFGASAAPPPGAATHPLPRTEPSEAERGGTVDRSVHNTTYINVLSPDDERRAERQEHRFAVLLADYYAHGLTQAQRSSVVSTACSLVGGLILMAGVALAIWRAETTGDMYAGAVTSVAGVLTGSIGVLYHRQARRALEHMEGQTRLLRQNMKAERESREAIRIMGEVQDPALRARLQAALVLRFSGAELPQLDPIDRESAPRSPARPSAPGGGDSVPRGGDGE